jgi:hypothetical protein
MDEEKKEEKKAENDLPTGVQKEAKAIDAPPKIQGWNWGAFFLGWIWAISHNTWIGLLTLVPSFGFIMNIVLGVKGNEWAWQNRQFESVEQFKAVQKAWTIWGIVYVTCSLISSIMLLAFFSNFASQIQ